MPKDPNRSQRLYVVFYCTQKNAALISHGMTVCTLTQRKLRSTAWWTNFGTQKVRDCPKKRLCTEADRLEENRTTFLPFH